jgi:hypothetical protein
MVIIAPSIAPLLEALMVRSRCESDAFAFWLGLDPRETNPWSLEGVDVMAYWQDFRIAVKDAGIRVTGRSLEGFSYHAPNTCTQSSTTL